ncbi:MAG: exosortase B [Rhodocyclaceae bacterium]|nr:MAG: exosortase B [Rhodocyclaceae bacterium]
MTPSLSPTLPYWRQPWVLLLAGVAALYLPTYWWALNTIWQTDEQAHGALILMVVIWLFWDRRQAIVAVQPSPAPLAGWICFLLGLAVYAVGRMLNVSILELGSQLPVLLGLCLLVLGWPGVRVAWFPLLYQVFMIPLPGILVDAVTGPLKQWVSYLAENSLYSAGYPVARHGVVLAIGQYQLLVADACSGLHSMFSLSALGILFLYLKKRDSRLHNALMVASILPIAFVANVVRVMVLVLVTYHLGDEAGQGFLHGAAGMVLMVVALLAFFLLDRLLAIAIKPNAG